MARAVTRGAVWTYRFKAPDKRRPVLVLSRDDVIDLLQTVMVAPITSTVHGAPSEVIVGPDGMIYITTSNNDGRGKPNPNDDKLIKINPEKL